MHPGEELLNHGNSVYLLTYQNKNYFLTSQTYFHDPNQTSPGLCPCLVLSHTDSRPGFSQLWDYKNKEKVICCHFLDHSLTHLMASASSLGMLTLGAVQAATWKGHAEKKPGPQMTAPLNSQCQGPSDFWSPGIPDISTLSGLMVKTSDDCKTHRLS
jgi:hypothetical protein